MSGKDPQGKDKIPKTWIPLKDMKESHSLEITEFAMAHRLNNKLPAFNWWVGHTLKKRSSIIASIKTRMAKTTQILSMELKSLEADQFSQDACVCIACQIHPYRTKPRQQQR